MGKFTESSYTILRTYFDEILVPRSGTDNSYLIGPKSGIVSDGGVYTILYELDPVKGFVGHNFKIVSISGNTFTFDYNSILSQHSLASALNIENELYFRKDSFFHEWLKFNSDLYKDDINVNKTFIFFGKPYPVGSSTTRINITFEGLKDFVYRILPTNNRNDNIEEWIKVTWDESYHFIYNLMKTMWSMIDAKEVNFDFLAYISNAFGISIKEGLITEAELREWVQNIAYFLKRKGTYSSYYIIWKLLLGNVVNQLNIYERWQEWCSTEISDNPLPWFTDHHYLEYYGVEPSGSAGDYYYSKFAGDYPTYSDPPSSTTGCIESIWNCTNAKSYKEFDELDIAGKVSIYDDRIFINAFNDDTEDIYLIDDETVPSGSDFHYCMTTYLSPTAVPSSSIAVWGLSSEQSKFEDHTGNWLAVSLEYSDTIKFKLYENYSGATYTAETTGSYSTGTDYFLTIYRSPISGSPSSSLITDIYDRSRRGENDRLEKVQLNLHDYESYTKLHGVNFVPITASPSGTWSGEVSDLYTQASTTNDVGLSGYWFSTPHYRVELDLSGQPLGDTYIINEDTIDELIRYWEYTRPVNKFVTYNYLLAPKASMAEEATVTSTYSELYNGYLNTVFTGSFFSSAASAAVANGDYVGGTYSHAQTTASSEWKITHNLGTNNILVQCFGENQRIIYPSDIIVSSTNVVTITFDDAVRGTAFISNADYTHTQTSSANEWNIIHSLVTSGGYSGPVIKIWDEDREEMNPSEIEEINVDQFNADFGDYTLQTSAGASATNYTYEVSAAGYGTVRRGNYIHTQSTSSATWNITHNLNAYGLIVEVFSGDIMVIPSEVTLSGFDDCTITFNEAISGTARLVKFPRVFTDGEDPDDPTGLNILPRYGSHGYWEIGNGFIENYDYRNNNRLINTTSTGKITSIEEDTKYYYINFTIPTGEDLTIKEIGIFNNEGDMMFYSFMSTLYKPKDVSITVHYRVLKPGETE